MKKQLLALLLVPAIALGAAGPLVPRAAAATEAHVLSGVSFREAPDVNSTRIRYLKAGEAVSVVEKVNAYWYYVQDTSGKLGYVSANAGYLDLSAPTVPQQPDNGAAKPGTGVIVASVSFREQASETSTWIRYLKAGENVQILEKTNSWWYKIQDASGRTGYVSTNAKYIQASGVPSSPTPSPTPTPTPKPTPTPTPTPTPKPTPTPTPTPTPKPTPTPTPTPIPSSEKAQKVIEAGKKYLGTPYEYGSSRSNTATFDCSDFVRQSFLDGLGLKLPSDSRSQGAYVKSLGGATTDWRQLKPGDIMFFMDYKGTAASNYSGINKAAQTISHSGIYLGNGQILHTYSKESGGVRIDNIAGTHWEYRFMFGGSAF
ncbi:C40 family peptidase [Paenibacillus athensensis]|uniref:Hydrolase Nlp/P60 n=1 Tax=Paenibacillus athensensis TaxID=1967502 RepID=A0A4Y8PUV5_9BACL|nr:SH3 domain-containing C40 family peptidase [Paenibacillus athensensis]MCD1258222.1 C40 family peptidase [Paenibacillus athensensis]